MLVYSGTKDQFIYDTEHGVLAGILKENIREKLNITPTHNEINSWNNSLRYMAMVLNNNSIPSNSGIAVEFNIPHTGKRVDLIITGHDKNDKESAIIIELKQWEVVECVKNKDAIVRTFTGGANREVAHPSYQAWSYAKTIYDFNETVRNEDICLSPCVCLHNYNQRPDDPILDSIYSHYISKAPMFFSRDIDLLRNFISNNVHIGDPDLVTLDKVDKGKIKPSKSLQDCLTSMLNGNDEFLMIDTQKVVYEEIVDEVMNFDGKKKVIIVKGGPGTGKSVLAINLLVKMINIDKVAAYVTKNAAPRNVYYNKLKGKYSNDTVKQLFMGSDSFYKQPTNAFDVILTDESHRLRGKSGMFQNCGDNQVKEIINSSKVSVFFIDPHQKVTLADVGSVEMIKQYANVFKADVNELELDSQFRCDGSDGYLAWIDNTLGISRTANPMLVDKEYDFRVFDDPNELRKAIEEKNGNNKSRLVAGYCWEWLSNSKDDSSVHDIVIPHYGFEISWNLGSSKTWAIDPVSVKEAGCIHTCQGLEFDYVGVIIGNDLRFENGKLVTDYTKRAKTDKSLNGLKTRYKTESERQKVAEAIIKNTYRVLMTRGMKGCYVFCTDKGLQQHLIDLTKLS